MYPEYLFRVPRIVLVLTLTTVITFITFTVQAREKIIIGLVPEMNVFDQVKRFQPLADHLSRKTGTEIQLSILNRYSNIIERLRAHEIDAAFLGSFTAAVSIAQLNAIPLARPLNLDMTSTYHAHIFVRKDSNISQAEDMRNKTMAFVGEATTAGYIFPIAWLRKEGVEDYTAFFKDYFFAGSHDAAIDAVLNRKADIGAAKNTIYEYYLTTNPRARENLIILASSQPVPSNSLCVMPTVSRETTAQLQAALLGLDKTTEGRNVLKKLRFLKFVPTDTADYEPVMHLAKEAGVSLESYSVPDTK